MARPLGHFSVRADSAARSRHGQPSLFFVLKVPTMSRVENMRDWAKEKRKRISSSFGYSSICFGNCTSLKKIWTKAMQNFDNQKVSPDMFLSPKTNCSIMSFKSLPDTLVVRELAMPRYCRTPMANCTETLAYTISREILFVSRDRETNRFELPMPPHRHRTWTYLKTTAQKICPRPIRR